MFISLLALKDLQYQRQNQLVLDSSELQVNWLYFDYISQ